LEFAILIQASFLKLSPTAAPIHTDEHLLMFRPESTPISVGFKFIRHGPMRPQSPPIEISPHSIIVTIRAVSGVGMPTVVQELRDVVTKSPYAYLDVCGVCGD
jgi:hypothetical protein